MLSVRKCLMVPLTVGAIAAVLPIAQPDAAADPGTCAVRVQDPRAVQTTDVYGYVIRNKCSSQSFALYTPSSGREGPCVLVRAGEIQLLTSATLDPRWSARPCEHGAPASPTPSRGIDTCAARALQEVPVAHKPGRPQYFWAYVVRISSCEPGDQLHLIYRSEPRDSTCFGVNLGDSYLIFGTTQKTTEWKVEHCQSRNAFKVAPQIRWGGLYAARDL